MILTLPAELEGQLSEKDARVVFAMGLYVNGKLSFGNAAMLAGVSRPEFQQSMARHRVPMDYTLEDLADDFAAIEASST
jgi:predicted HTH domain antitoxin